MKKIFFATLICLALNACNDPKADEKAVLNDVIKLHDKTMGFDEQVMHNKMKLDTLLLEAKNDEAKTRIKYLTTRLTKAESAMEDWMQNFDPAKKGTHEEIMSYITAQKKQITAVDTLLSGAVKESAEYLKPFKK
ncbi:MAG: hypothetical protein H7289_08195 [Mucilaginibacter sp.]|nr:hypothetical protein [Mucilaginibacter sp.]